LPEFTHGGGIVVRQTGFKYFYLLVRAKAAQEEWVFPKGHIESGEDAQAAALREVREEAGVEAEPLAALNHTEFTYKNEQIRVQFFLLKYLREVPQAENREKRWCTYAEALNLLSFFENRKTLQLAREKLAEIINL
jgi:mutator protein MutT